MRYFSTLSILFFVLTAAAQGQELTSADEYSQRGIARFEKNDLDGAIADFTKVIEMNGKEWGYKFDANGKMKGHHEESTEKGEKDEH